MTTSTIGASSRNYATVTLWQAALPTSGSGTWEGVLYKDAEFLENPTIGGSSAWPEYLHTAAGQSAFDNSANPLKYDATKGVGIADHGNYATTLTILQYCTLQGVQVRQYGGGNSNQALHVSRGNAGVVIDRCLFQGENSVTSIANFFDLSATGPKATNSVFISYHGCALYFGYCSNSILANCTFVSPSDKSNASAAIGGNANGLKATNCAFFGFASASGFVSTTVTATNNATDTASFGFTSASSLTSLTYANQFTGITTTGGLDFRLKSGNSLDGAGAIDTTDIPAAVDIFGTAR